MVDGKTTMDFLKTYTLSLEATVRDAIERMQELCIPAVAVVSHEGVLEGIFTNGDMRTFFLEGGSVLSDISQAMNPAPVCFHSKAEILYAKNVNPYIVYPLIDSENKLIDFVFESTAGSIHTEEMDSVPLVIMAGGKGTRLYPYTKVLPKALVPLGDKTISEKIIAQFYKHGCRDVCFILNHKAGMIKSYFDDLNPDYRVRYFTEKEFLGTGGGFTC